MKFKCVVYPEGVGKHIGPRFRAAFVCESRSQKSSKGFRRGSEDLRPKPLDFVDERQRGQRAKPIRVDKRRLIGYSDKQIFKNVSNQVVCVNPSGFRLAKHPYAHLLLGYYARPDAGESGTRNEARSHPGC
jgi:hypothetical protein